MKRLNLLVLLAILILAGPAWSELKFTEQLTLPTGTMRSLAYDGAQIWVNRDGQTLSAIDPKSGEQLLSVKLSAKGEYLAFDGRYLLLTSTDTKQILAVNRATGTVDPLIDLKAIQGGRDMYLEPLRSGEIMGIACGNGHIWLGCGAGYSSSIYEIDPAQHIVVSHRFSPGPTPVSLLYHQGNLWVLDKESEALRCLKDSQYLVQDLAVAVGKEPLALLDMNDKLFVAKNSRGPLEGVTKDALQALVPATVDMTTVNPFETKPRKNMDTRARKVAVLISGDTAASGYNEFWSDVVIMYRIMEARGYGEIYVLYADGRDYNCAWPKYQLKMTDFSASKANVTKVLTALANGDSGMGITRMAAADTLFVYTFDHGASDGNLCLWSGERYSPSEMAAVVKNIAAGVKMFYMQQCFSGAFKEEFKRLGLNNMAIVTAASNTQYAYRADTEKESYNGTTYYHGEFNWHFMSALMGKTPADQAVNADTNSDGKVSVLETFQYYQKMNSQSAQTPQYNSNPEAVGGNTP